MRSFASRIDERSVRIFLRQTLPTPVDALNLVDFADEISYRWYGLLLGPVVLAFGGRPVWVGVHLQALLGDKRADEIVIIRYPSHHTVWNIMNMPYYAMVNRLREKGVRRFEFSLTARHTGEKKIRHKGLCLVVHFNEREGSEGIAFKDVSTALECDAIRLLYASRETSSMDVFHRLESSDPNPTKYKETAIFAIQDVESVVAHMDSKAQRALQVKTGGISIQVYRRLRYLEAMPWAKRTISRRKS